MLKIISVFIFLCLIINTDELSVRVCVVVSMGLLASSGLRDACKSMFFLI